MAIIANRPSQQMVDLVGALGGTWQGNVATCRCPAHSDKTPSLSIRQGDRGILVTCFAGCDPNEILRELARIPLGRRRSGRSAPGRGAAAASARRSALRKDSRPHAPGRSSTACPAGPRSGPGGSTSSRSPRA